MQVKGIRIFRIIVLGVVGGIFIFAQTPASSSVQPSITQHSPRQIVKKGDKSGWDIVEQELSAAVLEKYERYASDLDYWYPLYRWAQLFSQTPQELIDSWKSAYESEKVKPVVELDGSLDPSTTLGDLLSTPFKNWLMGDYEFSRQFFSILKPHDFVPGCLSVLNELFQKHPLHFDRYRNLALAIALVHDVDPPAGWPHLQVPDDVFPRQLAEPGEVFDYFIRLNDSRQSAFDLRLLEVRQLVFLVDIAHPVKDLIWVRTKVSQPLGELSSVYHLVAYDRKRLTHRQFTWPYENYGLKTILDKGGICVDQAFFATQTAKAKGIPSMIFRGAGLDGRHAWFGFLKDKRGWEVNAGRIDDDRFITGYAHNPQTWGSISDHELKFLMAGVYNQSRYKSSELELGIGLIYLQKGREDEAYTALSEALRFEPLNIKAWDVMIRLCQGTGFDEDLDEAMMQKAIQSFRGHPELELKYWKMLISKLEGEGNGGKAARLRYAISVDNFKERSDLSVAEAAGMMNRSALTDSMADQERLFRVMVTRFGRTGDALVFDQLVLPFVRHMLEKGETGVAKRAVQFGMGKIEASPGSQLEGDLKQLSAYLEYFQ